MATKTPEQKERDAARNAAIRNAKETVRQFFATAGFKALDSVIQEALSTLAPVARQATSTLAVELKALFSEKLVLNELEIFKALKVGPNEMKAKVNHCLKLATPEDRLWISYDAAECTWSLLNEGAAIPDAFNMETLIPSVAVHIDAADFETDTINNIIAAAKSTIDPVAEPVAEPVE